MSAISPKESQAPERTPSSTTNPNAPAPSMTHQVHPILNLQRTIGNQAVLRLLQAGSLPGEAAAPRGAGAAASHPRFTYNFANIPVSHAPVRGIQRKLTVNTPGDVFEQEADHVAEQVMRMPDPQTAASHATSPAVAGSAAGIQRACACGGSCDDCKKKKEEGKKHKPLQMKAAGPASLGGMEAPPIVHDVLRSSGQPLDAATRAFMEPRFGHDFSKVRVHTDTKAAESAGAVQAKAYTVGSNVVFGAGAFAPGSEAGQRLVAHELTHVVQQENSSLPLQRQAVPVQDPPCPRGEMRLERGQPCIAVEPSSRECPRGQVKFGGDCVPLHPQSMSGELSLEDLPDPDDNERALATSIGTDLTKIDHKTQTKAVNEEIAQRRVMVVFGGPDGVDAVFERRISPSVRSMVDYYPLQEIKKAEVAGHPIDEQKKKEMITANRAQFLGRMRLYFNSWGEVVDHFSGFEKPGAVRDPKDKKDTQYANIDMDLNREARARFERAAMALKSKGHKLPDIGEGFSLRGYHQGDIQPSGYMIHALGNAFDIMAFSNPRITEGSGAADVLKSVVGEDQTRMDLDLRDATGKVTNPAPNVIAAISKRTAADPTLTAEADTDPLAVTFFQNFKKQFEKMQAGSKAFMNSLSKGHRDALLTKRNEYFSKLEELQAESRKKSPDAALIKKLNTEKVNILSQMPPLMTEWAAALETQVTKEIKQHPGMDKTRSFSEIQAELKLESKAKEDLGRAEAAEKRTWAELAAATRKVNQIGDKLKEQGRAEAADAADPHTRSKDWGPDRGPSAQKLREQRVRLEQALDKAKNAEAASAQDYDNARQQKKDASQALAKAASQTPKLKDELAKATPFQKAWENVDRLRKVRNMLTAPDLKTENGIQAFEELVTGDLREKTRKNAPADNPPLLRMLDIGFFNPTGNFDLAFFEEMAHSGFWPGASWSFGWVDAMHFEFVKGRASIQKPGADSL